LNTAGNVLLREALRLHVRPWGRDTDLLNIFCERAMHSERAAGHRFARWLPAPPRAVRHSLLAAEY
jgi:hypothetical protein